MLAVIISQFVPATVYGVFLILTAIKSQQWAVVSLIVLAQLALIVIGTVSTERSMHFHHEEIKVWKIKAWFDKNFTKPLSLIYVTWILRREPMLVVATKIFSGALLFAVTQLYKTDIYDWRLLAMGSVIAVAANYMMVTQLHQFENVHFQYLKNLPLNILKRTTTIVVVIFVLMIPEFSIVVKNFPDNLTMLEGLTDAAFIIAGALYFYSLNYLTIPPDHFSRWILGSVIGSVLTILFGVPLFLLTVAAVTTACLLNHFKYFSFEQMTSKTND
jgi:hypothetical protein